MARHLKKIDVNNKPDLLALVEQVETTGDPCLLIRDGRAVAIVYYNTAVPEPEPITEHSPLWDTVGMVSSDGPTDVSSNKHKYLAEAYADLHDSDE